MKTFLRQALLGLTIGLVLMPTCPAWAGRGRSDGNEGGDSDDGAFHRYWEYQWAAPSELAPSDSNIYSLFNFEQTRSSLECSFEFRARNLVGKTFSLYAILPESETEHFLANVSFATNNETVVLETDGLNDPATVVNNGMLRFELRDENQQIVFNAESGAFSSDPDYWFGNEILFPITPLSGAPGARGMISVKGYQNPTFYGSSIDGTIRGLKRRARIRFAIEGPVDIGSSTTDRRGRIRVVGGAFYFHALGYGTPQGPGTGSGRFRIPGEVHHHEAMFTAYNSSGTPLFTFQMPEAGWLAQSPPSNHNQGTGGIVVSGATLTVDRGGTASGVVFAHGSAIGLTTTINTTVDLSQRALTGGNGTLRVGSTGILLLPGNITITGANQTAVDTVSGNILLTGNGTLTGPNNRIMTVLFPDQLPATVTPNE